MGRKSKPELTTTRFLGMPIRSGKDSGLTYLRINMQEFFVLLNLSEEISVVEQLKERLLKYRAENRLITSIILSKSDLERFDSEVLDLLNAFAGEANVRATYLQDSSSTNFNLA